MSFTLSSCEEDDENCNCGEVLEKGVEPAQTWVRLKNECSDNTKKYVINSDKWIKLKVGDSFCADNVESWKPEQNK